jgi:hypothetical protein
MTQPRSTPLVLRAWAAIAILLTVLAARDLAAWHLGASGVRAGPRGAGQTLSFHRDLDRMYRTAGWEMAFSLGVDTEPEWGFDLVRLSTQGPPLGWVCGPLVHETTLVAGVRYLVNGWYVAAHTFPERPFAWNHGTGAVLTSGRPPNDPGGRLETEPALALLGRAPTEADVILWDQVFPDAPLLPVASWTCNDLHRTWLLALGGWLLLGGLGSVVAWGRRKVHLVLNARPTSPRAVSSAARTRRST